MAKRTADEYRALITEKLGLFGEAIGPIEEFRGDVTVWVPREQLLAVCEFLRDDPDLRFDLLSDVTALDRSLLPDNTPRFVNILHLMSIKFCHRLRVKTPVPEDDCWCPSVTSIWPTADWHERETYDMFGIEYRGHPDLRRILMPDGWQGWPLRKDFPLGGVKSFYYKRDTHPHIGEPPDLIPRIRVQDSDI
ncbi:MAG: hypothetical protein Kow0059_01180 [Candidatus Sumerlaeia bacterium]